MDNNENVSSSGTYAWNQDYEIGENGILVIKINLELNGKPFESYFPPSSTKSGITDSNFPEEMKSKYLPFCEKEGDLLGLYDLTFAELQSFRDSAKHYSKDKERSVRKIAHKLMKAVTWIAREIYLHYLGEENTRQLTDQEKNTMEKLAQRLLG
jgi:hypothetical protein